MWQHQRPENIENSVHSIRWPHAKLAKEAKRQSYKHKIHLYHAYFLPIFSITFESTKEEAHFIRRRCHSFISSWIDCETHHDSVHLWTIFFYLSSTRWNPPFLQQSKTDSIQGLFITIFNFSQTHTNNDNQNQNIQFKKLMTTFWNEWTWKCVKTFDKMMPNI